MSEAGKPGLTYAKAGVDIDAGARLVERLKPLAAATRRPGADVKLGGFGGLFDLRAAGYHDPVLVAGTDGVGTKLELAAASARHETIGIDLVAMCVNDVLVQGAEPLFFLDYFATGKLSVETASQVVAGIAKGCQEAGCALIGGETAEMPGMYSAGRYDLAGFAVGAAERGAILPHHESMRAGDALVALASSGPHSNGYSLIRRIVAEKGLPWTAPAPFDRAQPLGEALLTPTRIYVRSILPLIRAGRIKGAAHITGGGLVENPPRMCPEGLAPRIDHPPSRWPAVFRWLADTGGVAEAEMLRTFNCGIGMVLAVAQDDAKAISAELAARGETAWVCGALQEAAA